MARTRPEVEAELTVDVEATHLVLEVLVHTGLREAIRDVRISPVVARGPLRPDAATKGIADLRAGRSGRASFVLHPSGPSLSEVEIGATVVYRDSQGSRREATAPRVRLDLALPPLVGRAIPPAAFGDRASRAFTHALEFATSAPPRVALRLAITALTGLPMAEVEEAQSPSDARARASLFAEDASGVGYFVRIVVLPRAGGATARANLFSESEIRLLSLHLAVRAAVEGALAAPTPDSSRP